MRPTTLRWLALLVALLFTLPSVASSGPHYFCSMMERVLPACCCEHDAPGPGKSSGSQAKAADCCERIVGASHGGVATTRHAIEQGSSVALAAPPWAFELGAISAREESAPVPQAQAPPGLGPKIFLKNCSLLT
jgi:hypothetical protein